MMTMIPQPSGRASRGLRVARLTHVMLAVWAGVVAGFATRGPYWEGSERWIIGGVVIAVCCLASIRPSAEAMRLAASIVAGFGVWRAGVVQLTDMPAGARVVASATYITVSVLGLAVGTLTAGLAGLGGHIPDDHGRV